MPHNVSEGTGYTAFLGRYAGKAEKVAHPARAGATILTSIPPHAPQEGSKTDQVTLRAGRCSLPAEMHMGKVCKGEKDLSVQASSLSFCSASLRGSKRRFTIRKGCSTFKRTNAFLDSMPLSEKSAQARPSLVEGFLSNALAHR